MSGPRTLRGLQPTFRAVALTVVPEAARLDRAGWAEMEGIVEDALARRPKLLRRQLRLFLRALDWAALARHHRRFRALEARRRAELLGSLQDAPVLAVRRGTWGLRTLVLMGYYCRAAAAAEIGYGASMAGRGRP